MIHTKKTNSNLVLKSIFYLYILSFPLELLPVFLPIKTFFGPSAAISNSMLVCALGLVFSLVTIGPKTKIPSYITHTTLGVILLCASSFLMSAFLTPALGVLWGETPFDCIIPRCIFQILIPIVLLYNFYCFQLVSKKELINLFFAYSTLMLITGYVQFAMILGLPLSGLYDSLNIFEILKDSKTIISMERIPSLTDEPSYLASDLGTLIFPFLCACNLSNIKKKLSWIHLVLYLPIVYWSKSSTLIVVVLSNVLMWIYLKMMKNESKGSGVNKPLIFTLAFIFAVVLMFLFYNIPVIRSAIFKTTDTENLSTAYRYSTVVNDILVFLKYPLLGCGNGIQGFFYNENCPDWAYFSYETQASLSGANGVLNGGAFVPATISGYGILGIILVSLFIHQGFKLIRNKREEIGFLYHMYVIGIVAFLVNGIAAVSIDGSFHEMFILSLPLCTYSEKITETKTTVDNNSSLRNKKYLKPSGRFGNLKRSI